MYHLGGEIRGMTCAECHRRQVRGWNPGQVYRWQPIPPGLKGYYGPCGKGKDKGNGKGWPTVGKGKGCGGKQQQ